MMGINGGTLGRLLMWARWAGEMEEDNMRERERERVEVILQESREV